MLRFFQSRLRGDIPLIILLVRDMLIVGTAINFVFLGLAVAALEIGYPDWLALIVFLLPLPYNFFLWVAVWRSSAGSRIGGTIVPGIATLWLVIMFIV